MSRRMIAAEVLKLVRRRGQMVVAALTVVAVAVGYAITWGYHLSDAVRYGPAGGSHNLEGAMWVIATVGGVAPSLIGTTAGVGDQSAGVFRELVVTGRSRLVLFACRTPARSRVPTDGAAGVRRGDRLHVRSGGRTGHAERVVDREGRGLAGCRRHGAAAGRARILRRGRITCHSRRGAPRLAAGGVAAAAQHRPARRAPPARPTRR